jgi:hypothetical protein
VAEQNKKSTRIEFKQAAATIEAGKLYDAERKKYQGEALKAGFPLYTRLEKSGRDYQQPSIYGFKTVEGDTSYYTATPKSRTTSMLRGKGQSMFISNILQGFDERHMERTGFEKLELPKGVNIDQYYEKYFKKGELPKKEKSKDSEKIGSKVFNFLKRLK